MSSVNAHAYVSQVISDPAAASEVQRLMGQIDGIKGSITGLFTEIAQLMDQIRDLKTQMAGTKDPSDQRTALEEKIRGLYGNVRDKGEALLRATSEFQQTYATIPLAIANDEREAAKRRDFVSKMSDYASGARIAADEINSIDIVAEANKNARKREDLLVVFPGETIFQSFEQQFQMPNISAVIGAAVGSGASFRAPAQWLPDPRMGEPGVPPTSGA